MKKQNKKTNRRRAFNESTSSVLEKCLQILTGGRLRHPCDWNGARMEWRLIQENFRRSKLFTGMGLHRMLDPGPTVTTQLSWSYCKGINTDKKHAAATIYGDYAWLREKFLEQIIERGNAKPTENQKIFRHLSTISNSNAARLLSTLIGRSNNWIRFKRMKNVMT